MTLDRRAMQIPRQQLVDALSVRTAAKQSALEARRRRYGEAMIPVMSYMENIGWPELFGFDMNRYFSDASFSLEITLRERVFWADNVDSDDVPWPHLQADVGMYFDIALFGQRIRHTREGVPIFEPHPLSRARDLGLLTPHDFHTSGAMPQLHAQYRELKRLSDAQFDGKIGVGFPAGHRGPLDTAVQLRGYENLVEDMAEDPQFVHSLLGFLVDERVRYNRERRALLQEKDERRTFVADDWVNIPFISPAMFRDFVAPQYHRIQQSEGSVTGFHTCGNLVPVVEELVRLFPEMTTLDVSGWNDFVKLDQLLDRRVGFNMSFINTFVLTGREAEHRAKLEQIAALASRRRVSVCAQAIVRLNDTYDEDIGRVNKFIALARNVFGQA